MKVLSDLLITGSLALTLATQGASAHGSQEVKSTVNPQENVASAGADQLYALSAASQPGEVRRLLYKMYDDAYKLGDAVTELHPEQWKASGRKRAAFYRAGTSLRAAVTDFRKTWNEFYMNPHDAGQGRATLASLKGLESKISVFMSALANTPGADRAESYGHYAADLTALGSDLQSYVASLESTAQTSAASSAPSPARAGSLGAAPATGLVSEKKAAPITKPPASQPAPAAVPAPQPSSELTAPTSAPTAMTLEEARALLYKIYAAAYRIGDLTSALPTARWKITEDERKAFDMKSSSLRAAVTSFETTWKGFYEQPTVAELGQSTDTELKALLSQTNSFSDALENMPGSSSVGEYHRAATELSAFETWLGPYVAYLAAKEQPLNSAGAAGGTLKTEIIRSASAGAPLTSTSAYHPPLNNQQLKRLLYKAYVPAYRLQDLLGQEHPDTWKAPEVERTAFGESSQMLSHSLAELTKWRRQLDSNPSSLEAAFEVYATLGKIPPPADSVGRIVSQYADPKIGKEYAERARQVADVRREIEPYLAYLLRVYDAQTGTVQRNFAACEQELGFAMRPSRPEAVPMKNIIPDFKGRRTERVKDRPPRSRSHSSKKQDKKGSKRAAHRR